MHLFSWNERDNPDLPAAQVLADARKVRRRFRGASIGGGQEFGEKADHAAIDRAFGSRWSHIPRSQATPLIWNNWIFRLLAFGWVKTHDGVAHVTPHRGFSWGLFKRRRRPRLQPFYVYDTHLVSDPDGSPERLAFWHTHIEKMRAHIAAKATTGRDIFVVGDFNKKTAPHLHDRQQVLLSHWLDHVIWIPGEDGNQVQLRDTVVMHGPLFTDHKPIGVTLALSPKGSR